MKGQANAALYQCGVKNGSECKEGEESSLSGLRQSGDIDVYLEGGLDKVLAYARTFGEIAKGDELEMSVPVFQDTEVEFHYRPFIMRNPFKNAKLQKFFKSHDEANFCNRINLPNSSNTSEPLTIVAPTIAFNLVHQLVHTYHHFITEGVGLRQLMDYYFVLRNAQTKGFRKSQEVSKVVSSLGLDRFASALMWVIGYVFEGNDHLKPAEGDETLKPSGTAFWMLWKPYERDGRMLLEEILKSGNFGHHDETKADLSNKWKSFWYVNAKAIRFSRFDRWMWLWGPIWRIYHFVWRKIKGFK